MHTTRTGKILSVLFIAFLCALLLRIFVVEGYIVQGDSMSPTLQNGDYVFVWKTAYLRHGPQRGDIIVAVPRQYSQKVVKRVTVMPGELYETASGTKDLIDPKEYFVIGDNMPASIDSRVFGPVDLWDIKGRVIFGIRLKTLQILHITR